MNFACEQELSRTENTELVVSQGFSYTLADEKLGVGVEMEYFHEKSKGSPGENWFLIGPSLQWRPTSWSHVDLAPLIGCTHDSPSVEAYLVIGFDFGTGSNRKGQYVPGSLRSQ